MIMPFCECGAIARAAQKCVLRAMRIDVTPCVRASGLSGLVAARSANGLTGWSRPGQARNGITRMGVVVGRGVPPAGSTVTPS